MSLFQFFSYNYISILLIVGILIILNYNSRIGKHDVRMIKNIIFVIAVIIIVDALELWTASFSYPTVWRLLFSMIGYTLRPMIILLVYHAIGGHKAPVILWGIEIVNFLIQCTCFFSGIAFAYNEQNGFVRGPLGYTSQVVAFIFLICFVVNNFKQYYKQYNNNLIIIGVSAISITIASTLETLGMASKLLYPTILISILLYYLFIHIQFTKRDELTGLFNRQTFYADVHTYAKKVTGMISLDMNELKVINDTYGHLEGDKALTTLSNCFKECVNKNTIIYRIGGDEFIIVCIDCDEKTIQGIVKNIRDKVNATPYRCAIGYSMLEPKDSLDLLIQKADMAMYENKREMKK